MSRSPTQWTCRIHAGFHIFPGSREEQILCFSLIARGNMKSLIVPIYQSVECVLELFWPQNGPLLRSGPF